MCHSSLDFEALRWEDEEIIEGLLKTPQGLGFYRQRDEAAKELNVPKAAIDAELQVRRNTQDRAQART